MASIRHIRGLAPSLQHIPIMDDSRTHKPLPANRATTKSNTAPTASHTDPIAPDQRRSHEKSALHRRLHSNSLRHRTFTSSRDHHHRQTAKQTIQSAIELKPPISFDTLLRRDKKSPNSSRRGSQLLTSQQAAQVRQQQQQSEWNSQPRQPAPRLKVGPEDVRKAKEQNERREEELRRSLKTAEEAAMSNTRQLDDTYYSILDKASVLRATVASLQRLAEESRRMHSGFRDDATKLEAETRRNIDGFEDFNAQEKAIEGLVARLKKSKQQTNKLNQRLEACRNRVEAYEQREEVKHQTRRKRWGVVYVALAGVLVFIFAVIFVRKRGTIGSKLHNAAKALDQFGNEIASPITAALKPAVGPAEEDPRLRKWFDEL